MKGRIKTAEDFRQARAALGMSQVELAKALRFSKDSGAHTVRRIEQDGNGRGVPGPVAVATEALLTGWRPSGWRGK